MGLTVGILHLMQKAMSGSAADVVPTQEVFPQPQIRLLCALVEKMKTGR
jgi:hypothetical protein